MTTACHGSNVPDAKYWQRAGKIWFDTDPHARAYTSLLTDASANIVSRLANKELKPSSPTSEYRDLLNAKCISCHSNESATESQRVLGADCQVCHGKAEAWGSQHYSREWKSLSKSRFDGTDRIDLESFTVRARVCVSCHVGELNRTNDLGMASDRVVDHRLLAAGHPPMHFDFESYLRRYPVHWDTQSEPIGLGSATGVERWRIGKLTIAIARLKSLGARAERVISKSFNDSDWPELSEYSCSSCHHSLEKPSWRQDDDTRSIATWDDWTVSQLECAVRTQSIDELTLQLNRLKSSVEQISPDPALVSTLSTSLKAWLEMELEHVASPSENTVETMRQKLNSRMANADRLDNWETATQWYIATRLLSEGLGMSVSKTPVAFVKEDPFVSERTWLPTASVEFDTPKSFHPNMLKDYSNDLKLQLRTRP
jgi:hypothetical protein